MACAVEMVVGLFAAHGEGLEAGAAVDRAAPRAGAHGFQGAGEGEGGEAEGDGGEGEQEGPQVARAAHQERAVREP